MRDFKLFLLLVYFANFSTSALKESPLTVSETLHNAINRFYIESEKNFEIILYENSTNRLNGIISEIGSNFVTSFTHISDAKQWNHEIPNSAVILMESFESFENFNRKVQLRYFWYPANFTFLVFIEDLRELSSLENLKEEDPNNKTQNYYKALKYFYFIIELEKEIKLATFEWFTEELCDRQQLRVIDTFDKTSKTWKEKFNPEQKFMNFHNCAISFFVISGGAEAYYDLEGVIQGFFVDIDRALAEKGNLTPIFETVTQTYALLDSKIIYACHVLQTDQSILDYTVEGFHITSTISEANLIFLITPGELYTKWEKMILPFDFETWIYTLFVFGFAFLVTFAVNKMSIRVRNLFLGSSAQYPAYNILGTFFGISQTRVPEGNFARIILTYFILFCLIIRTAYQGKA